MSLVAHGVLSFKLEVTEGRRSDATAYAGVPLVLEQARVALPSKLYRELRDALGYKSTPTVRRHVESMLVLLAAGGDCIDDLRTLRADAGLRELVGFELSSPTQLKEFLYRFHQDEHGKSLTPEQDAELSQVGKAQIRPEGPGLRALTRFVAAIVERVQKLRPRDRATLDVDATIVEADKRRALVAYEGTRGYQPQMAFWAEQGIWVRDQFRDGNVPAEFDGRAFLQQAFAALPSIKERRLRADSALYNEEALTWAHEQGIQFAVSADMSEALAKAIRRLPESAWAAYRTLRGKEPIDAQREERQWAEVEFIPNWARNHKKSGETFRYIAIRVRSCQRDLFTDDAVMWRHFAVVTNMLEWDGERLLRWHREKQGTVEQAHGVIKGDLAGGTLPCFRFGANAAWWRLNVLVHNLLELLKAEALPAEFGTLRPKALRFRLFNVAGRLLHGARQIILRLSAALPSAATYARARETLRAALRAPSADGCSG